MPLIPKSMSKSLVHKAAWHCAMIVKKKKQEGTKKCSVLTRRVNHVASALLQHGMLSHSV